MTRRALGVPYLAEWVATLKVATATQYASCIRGFFQGRPAASPAKVGREDLVTYCAAIESQGMRWKMTGALDSYFTFLADHGYLDRHPAYGLARRVAAARAQAALLSELRSTGVTKRQAAALRWRHVAQDIVGPRRGLPAGVEASTRVHLVNGLLERLRAASADTVEAILDRPLLE